MRDFWYNKDVDLAKYKIGHSDNLMQKIRPDTEYVPGKSFDYGI